MTRDDVKKLFPEATDESITALLNQHHNDVQKEKARAESYKADNERLKDIEKEAEALKNANLSAEEKLAKATKEAEDAKRDFNKRANRLEAEKLFVASGLTEKDYASVLDGIVTDNNEVTMKVAQSMAGMLNAQKEAVKAQLLKDTPRPKGGSGNTGVTKEQFKAMGYTERLKLFQDNPEQYKELIGGN